MDRDDTSSAGQEDIGGEGPWTPETCSREALFEVARLVTVLETERDLLVSGDWEKLDPVLEEKSRRSRRLGELLSGLSPESFGEGQGEAPTLRSALVHLSELATVNHVLARESALIVEQVVREIALDAEGGGTYGASGEVGTARPSPAMVSTRG
ncbi:MAG: flagellar protein FlgN [Nitrospirae bacterium]|nr:MAG: hypothetical protein D084_Lepto4C00234G0004 [Leptospirillum sp. Group IV 'UBA BS']MCL4485615.1 flagellar protein FlgN [Nitrospirota bacterium]